MLVLTWPGIYSVQIPFPIAVLHLAEDEDADAWWLEVSLPNLNARCSVIALVSIMHISFHERRMPRDFFYGPFFSVSRDFQDLIIRTSLASQVCGDWKLEPLFNWAWRSSGIIVRTSPMEILVCFVLDQNSQISIGMKPESGERFHYRLHGIFQPECWVSAKEVSIIWSLSADGRFSIRSPRENMSKGWYHYHWWRGWCLILVHWRRSTSRELLVKKSDLLCIENFMSDATLIYSE